MARTPRPKKEKPAKPDIAQMGGNLSGLKEDLAKWRDSYIEFEKKRSDVNANLGEIRAKAEANGIPKKAFAAALSYYKMDPDQRSGLDNGYILAREAFGLPIAGAQLSLFGDEIETDDDNDDENDGDE